ncbi:MAG: threonine-phosphate decarboxylase [Deltaproteobacteria bacterium]|nr:threonine-phosphate decarboxylase [Deltaproteobacteria bacterium]
MDAKHGGNIYEIARQTGKKVDSMIDFSASINPVGYSARVKKMFASVESLVVNYPDKQASDFTEALAAHHSLEPDTVLPGNGSTEFIYLLPGILRPKSVLIVAPAFTEYEHSYQRAKGVVFYFQTDEKDGFEVQHKRLLDELKRGYSALYLCNPASPNGAVVSKEKMQEVIAFAAKKGTSVIVDETFMDYVEKYSIKALVKKYDNLYVLRSMTKFFALPGLRAGCLISHSKNIEKIRLRQAPWSINALAQRAGTESLKDVTYIQKSIDYMQDARAGLVADLKTTVSLKVYKGSANFLLIKLAETARMSAPELYGKLLERGLIVRTCEDFNGLDEQYFRVAVKKKNENKKLVSEINKIFSGGAAKKPAAKKK